jgi:hypothetical protein
MHEAQGASIPEEVRLSLLSGFDMDISDDL